MKVSFYMEHFSIFRQIRILYRYRFLLSIFIFFMFCKNIYASEINLINLTESSAVEVAVSGNPNLAEMQARYSALLDVPSQVSTLPDPTVSFNAMNFPTDTYDRSQEPMTQLQFGISQAIPFPGKLRLKKEAANYDAQAAGYSVDELHLRLVKNVKSKWWQLYYLDRALETVKNNQTLLRQFITVTQTKYETGKGLQQDVLLAQLEFSKLIDQEILLKAIRRNEMIQLNVLMGRPANTAIELASDASKSMPDLVDENVLYMKAETSRPLLKQMEVQIDAAQSRLDLAKREYYPDFKLGITYGDRTGNNASPMGGERSDFLSVMVGVTIPLYAGSKQSKKISQKSREKRSKQYALLDKKGIVTQEISTAVTDYQRAKQQFSLFSHGIVPQARQTVQSMMVGYQVSEVDFLNLLRSQITLFNYELQYWKALSDAKQALASLEAAVGEETVYE